MFQGVKPLGFVRFMAANLLLITSLGALGAIALAAMMPRATGPGHSMLAEPSLGWLWDAMALLVLVVPVVIAGLILLLVAQAGVTDIQTRDGRPGLGSSPPGHVQEQ